MYKGKNKQYLKQSGKPGKTSAVVSVTKTSTAAALYGLVSGAVTAVASTTVAAVQSATGVAVAAVNATSPYVKEAATAVLNATLTGGASIEPPTPHQPEVCYNATNPTQEVPCPPYDCDSACVAETVTSVVGVLAVLSAGAYAYQKGLFKAGYEKCKEKCSSQNQAEAGETSELTTVTTVSPGYGGVN